MQTCQDNYSTVFSSFGEMQTYHQRLSQESQWRRCRVRDLTIEPLDSKSPLAEDLPAFAPGTSQEAVRDTVRGLGLAMRVQGSLYPMRDTAYKSRPFCPPSKGFPGRGLGRRANHSWYKPRSRMYRATASGTKEATSSPRATACRTWVELMGK